MVVRDAIGAVGLVIAIYSVIMATLIEITLWRTGPLVREMSEYLGDPAFWEIAAYYDQIVHRSWHARASIALLRFATFGHVDLWGPE